MDGRTAAWPFHRPCSTYYAFIVNSASEVTTLRRYTNLFIIIIFLAYQHKACRQLKIKQEMTAVGD